MPQRRRIKALQVLQRLKEHELDQHAAEMGEIRAHQAQLQTEITTLQTRLETEAQITAPESAPYLAGFLNAVNSRRAFLDAEMHKLDQKAAQIEGRLLQTYTEARSNESVLNKTLHTQRRIEDMAETTALEEIARTRYLRQKRGDV
ncbi:hypothetical protein N6L24_14250 [Cognatishimia sp. SS12]|uniref:hypothetical protein n=1 Tax=Cognatishimia sp. SS12 TaxID=2979465 RepID=UPI00232D1C7A|nr:hypothetical protein [Cognatishimia sp. SS12]MDC0739446.1 hypothetical protein [Cognatishimia sp. SS12]